MEVVDIQEQQQQQDDEDFSKRVCAIAGGGGGGGVNHLRGWQHSSRIIRVARASGSKDRHSKVLTSKGLRDRRVRLSVSTAIQFYDLQDRLGFEQPSKAVEWLIEAASDAIAELPSLKNSFPDTPEQLMSDEKIMMNQMQNLSSTSETSKGSVGLSLSRSEILVNRAKARDRARERTAKDKEKEREHESHNVPSFTELLTVGIGNPNTANSTITTTTTISGHGTNAVEPGLFDKTTAMDYFASSGIIANNQINMISAATDSSNHNQDRLQHFSFVPENLNDYNLNFTISGFNRGTLQSNISPSLLPYFQRFPHVDGSNLPVVIGAASPAAPVQSENHHHHHHHQLTPALFDGGWQLCYAADGNHHSDQKGKGKN